MPIFRARRVTLAVAQPQFSRMAELKDMVVENGLAL
jgi:hypothetical protein